MKAKLLLCMMMLGLLTATAQPPQPRILEDGFYLMPTPHQVAVKPMKAKGNTMKNRVYTNTKRNKARADEPTYQVDFVLDFDIESQKAKSIRVENKDAAYNYDSEIYTLQRGSNVMSVPGGTYDIIVEFYQLDTTQAFEWPLYTMYVIHEHVVIDQDMTMNFASSEAKNHIHFQTFTIDGEPVYTGKWAVDENWNWTQLEQGNIDDVNYQNILLCKDIELSARITGNFGVDIEGEVYHQTCGERIADFFVSDVSDRYTFNSYRVATKDHLVYTSSYEVQGASNDTIVSNDPIRFTLFEEPFLVSSRQGEDLYMSLLFGTYRAEALSFWSRDLTLPTPLAEGETCKYYISASADDSKVGFIPIIQPELFKSVENGSITPFVLCMPLVKMNDELHFANNGTGGRYSYSGPSFISEYSEELDNLGRDVKFYPNWPTHPVFSYNVERKIDNLGNNCPLFVSGIRQYVETAAYQSNPVLFFDFDYCGRYGEKRIDNPVNGQVCIKLDGQELITWDGPFRATMPKLLNGVVDASIINENIVVDDLSGSNKAQLHFIAGAEDESAPTMTMLHFKASNGDVTDRFSTADEGTLEFTAGDFNFWRTPNNYDAYDRYAPESVDVSYSPYGEDNWNELPVEEVPENYWPVMGWFYTGSLAGVTGQGLNGWFDLKIRLTDAAGNWQEQVLSPAFRIDDHAYSSVASVGSSNAHEVARYNLAGQHVDANATGVVIIKMSDGTARKVIL